MKNLLKNETFMDELESCERVFLDRDETPTEKIRTALEDGEDVEMAEREIVDAISRLVRLAILLRDESESGGDDAGNAPTILLQSDWRWARGRTFAEALRRLGGVPHVMYISDDPEICMDGGGYVCYASDKGYTAIPLLRDAAGRARPPYRQLPMND